MPKLARLRFVSIGYSNARMQDLTLNFTDQSGLPSDSTIWLRNGGGKTSILSLFFALPRPNRRDFLGSRADAGQRRIEDYILANDRSVVAAEWTLDLETLGEAFDPTTVPRFLTGVFYEYAGGNKDSLRRLFFCVRVNDSVPETLLESIPTEMKTEDGGHVRRTMMSFKQRWRQLAEEHPGLQFFCTDSQSEWSAKLQSAGMDPGLFGYQLTMNSHEGGADELFRFNNPDDFIDFLLELTVEPTRADGITENLETYRKQLQRRKHELLPDLTLSTGLAERLTPLVELHDRRLRTMEEASKLNDLYARIGASIDWHKSAFAAQELSKADEIHSLRGKWNEADAKIQRDRALAAAIYMRLAQDEAEQARRQVAELTESVEQAKRDDVLWRAAYPYREYVIAQKDVEAYRERLAGTDSGRQPLLDKIAVTAMAYAGAIRHQVTELQTQRENIRSQSQAAEEESRKLEGLASAAEREAFGFESEQKSYLQNIEARKQKYDSLIKLGIMQDNETPAAALDRTAAALKSRKGKLRAIERGREGSNELEQNYSDQILDLQKSTAQYTAEKNSLEAVWKKANIQRDALESDEEFLSLLEVEEIDLDEMADDAAAMLQRHASEMQENAARLRTEAASLERARVHIAENGLMPPSVQVENLLNFLGPKSAAKSGWAYLCENYQGTPEQKEKLARAFPAIAEGLIVPVEELENIRRRIEMHPEAIPEIPIMISSPEAFDVMPEFSSRYQCVVGPKDHAWFDAADAQKCLADIENRLQTIRDDVSSALQKQDDYINAAMKYRTFRSQYPRGWFASTKAKLSQMQVRLDDDTARLDMQNEEKKRLIERRRADEHETTKINNDILGLERAVERLKEFVCEIDDSVDAWRRAAEEKGEKGKAKRNEADNLRAQAEQARCRVREIFQTAEPVASQISLLENEFSRIHYINDKNIDSKQGDIEGLRREYTRLCEQIEREFSSSDIMRSLEQAQKEAAKQKSQTQRIIKGVLNLSDVQTAVESLVNPNDLEINGERAQEMVSIMTERKEKAVAALSACESALKQRQNTWFGLGKPAIPDELNGSISLDLAKEFDKHADDGNDILKKIDEDIRACEAVISNAKHCADSLGKDKDRLQSIYRSNASYLNSKAEPIEQPPFEADEISPAISQLEQRLEKYREAHGSLDGGRKSCVAAIRKWVDSEQFADLQNKIITQFKNLDPESLENSAAKYRDEISVRIRELSTALEEMEKHRNMLAKFLLTAADDGLRLLKLADSASMVPKEVPDIGGSRFLRITTKESPSQSDRLSLIQELVDTLVDETVLPTGVKLIQRAVRQIARPFSVRVLNPDPASPQHLIDIVDTTRFSGGEQMTCAILLYCTLANVRARTRGMNRQPTSVLILDNPIGRASRTVFINMQRRFASAMGIQLIYTTAVNDLEALSNIPNVIRLRNERTDLHRGQRFIEREEDIHGLLDAMRIYKTERGEENDEMDDLNALDETGTENDARADAADEFTDDFTDDPSHREE